MADQSTFFAPHQVRHPAYPPKALSLVEQMPTTPVSCMSTHLYIHHRPHQHEVAHPFVLMFYPPYLSGKFICNLCRETGGCHWLYRCTICDNFDAHLGCAIRAAQLQFQLPQLQSFLPTPPAGAGLHDSRMPQIPMPSSDLWKKLAEAMLIALRLGNLASNIGGFVDVGSTVIETLQQLLSN
ncbi:unnamed protein product [Victoria cruziana]